MRIRCFVLAAVLLVFCIPMLYGCAPKPNYAGIWNGSISVTLPNATKPISIPLVFHVTKKDDGTYTSTLDVAIQNLNAFPVETFAVDANKVTINIKLPGGSGEASFAGTSNADATEITGNFSQNGNILPLKLTKTPDAK